MIALLFSPFYFHLVRRFCLSSSFFCDFCNKKEKSQKKLFLLTSHCQNNIMITISSQLNATPEASISHPQWSISHHLQNRLTLMNISYLFPVQSTVLPLLKQSQFSTTPISPGDLLVSAVLYGFKFKSEVKVLSSSTTDILVCTPGRLVDHLQNKTPGLDLQHLRFLVIDESDRLLGHQEYQDWISKILEATQPIPTRLETNQVGVYLPVAHPQSYRYLEFPPQDSIKTLQSFTPLQKLLFSATLSNDITKLACLRLHEPQWICVESQSNKIVGAELDEEMKDVNDSKDLHVSNEIKDSYVAPPTLDEFYLVTNSIHDKPLLLFYLLFCKSLKGVLVFTKSIESAHKLAFLVESMYRKWKPNCTDTYCHAITSDLYKEKRQEWIQDFQAKRISVLICSDVMARGMDLGESVESVINYDIFTDMKTYVHRMGRCARAGRHGSVYSLLESQQVKWFKQQVKNGIQRGEKKLKQVKVSLFDEHLLDMYKTALNELHSK